MVNFQLVDAHTVNTTAWPFEIYNGTFGIQQTVYNIYLPANDGKFRNISIHTSDVYAALAVILVSTFAIDRYFYKSRYLIRIGGAKRAKDQDTILEEKAAEHEKEAFIVESGNAQDSTSESSADSNAQSTKSGKPSPWLPRLLFSLVIICFWSLSDSSGSSKKKSTSKPSDTVTQSATTKEKEDDDVDRSTGSDGEKKSTSWLQYVSSLLVVFMSFLVMLGILTFHLVFWPCLVWLLVMFERADLGHISITPWKPVAMKVILSLVAWMCVFMPLLLKTHRWQGTLWKAFKWTHAINWWLFWGAIESFTFLPKIANYFGASESAQQSSQQVVMFLARPCFFAYIFSGTVCSAVVAYRVIKHLWVTDILNRE